MISKFYEFTLTGSNTTIFGDEFTDKNGLKGLTIIVNFPSGTTPPIQIESKMEDGTFVRINASTFYSSGVTTVLLGSTHISVRPRVIDNITGDLKIELIAQEAR
jgi:hypothetical protein